MTPASLVQSPCHPPRIRWARPVGYGLALGVSGLFWATVLGVAGRL